MSSRETLTHIQVQDIISESRAAGTIAHYADAIESGFAIPEQIGRGAWTQILVREGLRLGVLDVVKRQPHVHLLDPDTDPCLTSMFYVAGRSQMSLRALGTHVNRADYSYGFYLPGVAGVEEFPAGEQVHIVQLTMSVNLFREFCLSQPHRLPAEFQSVLDSRQQPFLFQFGILTPAMRTTLQQILDCPYTGFVKRLYLESKALELLSLQFQQAIERAELAQVHASHACSLLHPADVERIHAARDILSDRIQHPPGLMELARLVGLNDFKLKQGFKQVFGTTVFGYVYECRMQQAQQMLQARQMNIEEVARALGYANRSSFAVAFRRKFGVNPKRFLI
mgnify:CR=1 FL=1